MFQAVSLYDDLVAAPADEIGVEVVGAGADQVPTDGTNLAVRAARLLADRAGVSEGVALRVTKRIPVAGGMAGGSADAAAALLACDALWRTGLARDELRELCGELGSDVPFSLVGGTAVGTGRGDQVTPALARGEYHWVLALAEEGLSTPAVYAECDRLREGRDVPGAAGAAGGDAGAAHRRRRRPRRARCTTTCSPRRSASPPHLERTLEVGRGEQRARRAWSPGSGPTVAFLVPDAEAGHRPVGRAVGVRDLPLRAARVRPGRRRARWSSPSSTAEPACGAAALAVRARQDRVRLGGDRRTTRPARPSRGAAPRRGGRRPPLRLGAACAPARRRRRSSWCTGATPSS